MNTDYKAQTERFLNQIWQDRANGLPTPHIDWSQPLRAEAVEYLTNHLFPFIQVVSTEPEFPDPLIPQFYRARSGWMIHDYTAAMSTSPGEYLFGLDKPTSVLKITYGEDDDDEGGETGGSIVAPDRGTIIKQQHDTIDALIALIRDKGWPGFEIVAGSTRMKSLAWAFSKIYEINLEGYEATKSDEQRLERISQLRSTTQRKLRRSFR